MTTLSQLFAAFDPAGVFEPPAEWSQGRTLYGGLTAALALQAARTAGGAALPPLKSAQILYAGPAAGPLRFTAQLLRRGKSATAIGVDCLAGGDVALRAAFLFAQPRASAIAHDFTRFPDVEPPDAYERREQARTVAAFFDNFELRPAGGSLPLSGSDHPEFMAWVRHRDASGVDPSLSLVALGDCLPPAAISSLTQFAPLSSMNWNFELPRPATAGEWFLLCSSSRRAADGYSFQTMRAWNEARELVLTGSQTVAIFA
jgi:acyl-CoA thioesterase